MLHPKVELRESRIQGKGLFATDYIPEGDVVWWESPEDRERQLIVPVSEVKNWPEEKQAQFLRYAYQVGEDLYSGRKDGVPVDPADFTNHSCDPTTWFVNDATMTARRDIQPGEEITYDYATSETDGGFMMVCACGASNCRRLIRGTDHLLVEVRESYGGHVMQHALRKVRKSDGQKATKRSRRIRGSSQKVQRDRQRID